MKLRFALPFSAAALGAAALTGCVPNATGAGDGIAVSSTSDACKVATDTAPAGPVVFHVTNDGSDVTEFYVMASDGLRIISEVENIGPGITRDLVVRVSEGEYLTVCKPGMVGDGIRATFRVTASEDGVAPTSDREDALAAAADQYVLYVRDQVKSLVSVTDEFVAAYEAGDDDKARELYTEARVHWERIEPVAESFGDLDPKMDAREADVAEGDTWTGWHRMEKNLWPPVEGYALTQAERTELAEDLKANTAQLSAEVMADDFTLDASQIGNGAKGLLDEVASGKVTGEEEIWSHTDLYDFQANVDGAAVAFGVLRDVVNTTDPDLVSQLDTRFANLNSLLAQYGSIDNGFASYTDLSADQIKQLSDAVNALSEPLSRLTAAAVL